MFRFPKSVDVITLFHKPSLPTSTRVLNILRTASANAGETATIDQASDHSDHNKLQKELRGEFELDVTEAVPTSDQLNSIIDYLQAKGVNPSAVMEGAKDKADALKKLKEFGDRGFIRPVVVDWVNGRATVGDNESEILKLVREAGSS
ncbi:thioredoxin-like protein [Talaromyces proteolyticus]|uniref:Thioredoxin-like protein n=1 Tax=Talaromyces proteolyticus TaxID=1131652 RepID=A0AAD4L2T8_9EURO|nr:thioredoxin-like protein [Talaromyces proteolyticus]KAH8705576.1 thioredoxin-like protein [Talaromyces proteolyticus]